MADNSVGHEQLTSNSVRVDEIQANAVGHSEMQDAAVALPSSATMLPIRLCPDPSPARPAKSARGTLRATPTTCW